MRTKLIFLLPCISDFIFSVASSLSKYAWHYDLSWTEMEWRFVRIDAWNVLKKNVGQLFFISFSTADWIFWLSVFSLLFGRGRFFQLFVHSVDFLMKLSHIPVLIKKKKRIHEARLNLVCCLKAEALFFLFWHIACSEIQTSKYYGGHESFVTLLPHLLPVTISS